MRAKQSPAAHAGKEAGKKNPRLFAGGVGSVNHSGAWPHRGLPLRESNAENSVDPPLCARCRQRTMPDRTLLVRC